MSEGTVSWQRTAGELSMPVGCDGAVHELHWQRGVVVPVDHPELDAERGLVGLGGPEPACLAMLRLWDDAVADGGFLAEWIDDSRLTPAWFSWLAMALERMRTEGFHEFLRRLPPARAQRMGEFLHRFPPAWIDRAAAAVAEAVTAGPGVGCDQAPSLIPLATSHRLRRAFVDSVGGRQVPVGAAALVPLSIEVRAGARPAVAGSLAGPGRAVSLTVDDRWLHLVWAAGAAVIEGRLVLGRRRGLAAVVVWNGGSAGPTLSDRLVVHDGQRWRLAAV